MTLHVYADMEQRSPEWYAARCGIVTASVVGRLLTVTTLSAEDFLCPTCLAEPNAPCLSQGKGAACGTPIQSIHRARTALAVESKGKPSSTRIEVADNETSRGVIASLVAERITGIVEPTFTSDDMWRGVDSEPYARDVYSGFYSQATECGFMVRSEDGWTLGLSPDGLVADEGGVEIKCPRAKGHINTILADAVPTAHIPQIQAALLVTGRKWWDFVSFHAGLPLFVKRVHPDPAWHEAIIAVARNFETTATEMVAAYENAVVGMPTTERISLDNLGLVF